MQKKQQKETMKTIKVSPDVHEQAKIYIAKSKETLTQFADRLFLKEFKSKKQIL